VVDRQCRELFAPGCEEHVANHHQSVCSQLVQRRKDRIEIAFSAGIQDMKLQAEAAGGWLQTSREDFGIEICRVDE
jgi:hypothetical protein